MDKEFITTDTVVDQMFDLQASDLDATLPSQSQGQSFIEARDDIDCELASKMSTQSKQQGDDKFYPHGYYMDVDGEKMHIHRIISRLNRCIANSKFSRDRLTKVKQIDTRAIYTTGNIFSTRDNNFIVVGSFCAFDFGADVWIGQISAIHIGTQTRVLPLPLEPRTDSKIAVNWLEKKGDGYQFLQEAGSMMVHHNVLLVVEMQYDAARSCLVMTDEDSGILNDLVRPPTTSETARKRKPTTDNDLLDTRLYATGASDRAARKKNKNNN